MAACTTSDDPVVEPTDSTEVSVDTIEESVDPVGVAGDGPVSDRLRSRAMGLTPSPLGYNEYVPPGYGDGEQRPLLVFIHGLGGNGDGSAAELTRVAGQGVMQLIKENIWPGVFPFVVLAPQHRDVPALEEHPCLTGEFWGTCLVEDQAAAGHPVTESPCMTPNEVHDFVDFAVENYDVDPDRVYLAGVSCGAFTVWEYLAEFGGEQVAAAVALSGEGRPAWEAAGCDLAEVPIWAFHGDQDDVVEPDGSIVPVEEISECPGADLEINVYEGIGHNDRNGTFSMASGNQIYDWMLEHVRD